MMRAILLLSLLLAGTAVAKDGTGVGNGGDVVVCPDRLEFLDLFESREVYRRIADLGPPTLTAIEKVRRVAERNREWFPILADRLLKHASEFESKSLFAEADLDDVSDSGNVTLPPGCSIKQLIIRKDIPVAGKDYYVDARYWSRLDSDSKAAAIMHEFFYGRAVDLYLQKDSVRARWLHGYFLSDFRPADGLLEWARIFGEAGQGIEEYWGPRSWKERRLVGYATAPLRVETRNFGTVALSPGEYELDYRGGLPVLIRGTLMERRRFANDHISILASGEVRLFEYSQHPRISLTADSLDFERFENERVVVKTGADCAVGQRSFTFDGGGGFEFSPYSYGIAPRCAVEVAFKRLPIAIRTPCLERFEIANDGVITIKIAHCKSQSVIDSQFGTHEVTGSEVIVSVGTDTLSMSSPLSSHDLDGVPVLGVVPRMTFGRGEMTQVRFQSIKVSSIARNEIEKLHFKEATVSPIPGSELKIAFGIYAPQSAVDGKITDSLKGKIELVRLDGFAGDYLGALDAVEVPRDGNVAWYRYARDRSLPVRDRPDPWVKKAAIEDQVVPLSRLVHAIGGIGIDLDDPELFMNRCSRTLVSGNDYSRHYSRKRLHLTRAGKAALGRDSFDTDDGKYTIETCLSRKGVELSNVIPGDAR